MTNDANPRLCCPLCGGNNQCTGAVSSAPHEPCWCTSVTIARETIEQIPKERLGVCICPQCARTTMPGS